MKLQTFTVALFGFISIINSVTAQSYNSSIETKWTATPELTPKSKAINISATEISVSNFKGGTKLLKLKVNEIKEKEDWRGDMVKWYYCSDVEKDFMTGEYTQFIITVKKSNPKEVSIHQKLDDVTFIRTDLSW